MLSPRASRKMPEGREREAEHIPTDEERGGSSAMEGRAVFMDDG